MGYSAYVPCNCYKEGKVNSRPPYEEFVIDGDEGLELNFEWEGNQDKHNEFFRWKHGNVCLHENMWFCQEGLANASGMWSFREICHKLGEKDFPILNKYLPTANSGSLPSEYATQLLAELDNMKNIVTNEKIIALVETTKNNIIYSINYGFEREFVLGGNSNCDCGLGNDGLYILKKYDFFGYKFAKKIWTSKSFTQEKNNSGDFFFKDKVSGNKINLNIDLMPLEGENNDFFEFEVIEKKTTINDEYAYTIEPLIRLAKASIETGKNICWI